MQAHVAYPAGQAADIIFLINIFFYLKGEYRKLHGANLETRAILRIRFEWIRLAN